MSRTYHAWAASVVMFLCFLGGGGSISRVQDSPNALLYITKNQICIIIYSCFLSFNEISAAKLQ